MERLKIKKTICIIMILALALPLFSGCKWRGAEDERKEDVKSDNIIITETGETIQKEEREVITDKKWW